MQGRSIYNGKYPGTSQLEALSHFVECVTEAMTTGENEELIDLLKSKFRKGVAEKNVSEAFIQSMKIFKTLSPVSSNSEQGKNEDNQLCWNRFKFDQTINLCVGSLKWTAPKISGALIKIIFGEDCTHMFYSTGYICDVFGKCSDRTGRCEELKLPREGDEDLSGINQIQFLTIVDSTS